MSDELLKQILGEIKDLKSDVQELKSEVKEIKAIVSDVPLIRQAVLETNDTAKRIESNQDRQERILEMLSVRSIEQEANLKRLR